jgi:hypothetical protein
LEQEIDENGNPKTNGKPYVTVKGPDGKIEEEKMDTELLFRRK